MKGNRNRMVGGSLSAGHPDCGCRRAHWFACSHRASRGQGWEDRTPRKAPRSVSQQAKTMAKATGEIPNLVWFNYRRVPAIPFAKELITDGRLGQPFHYRAVYLNQSGQ
jgi:hypothetical protein